MHFQLPQNLIAQVVAYDPVLKPLAKAAKEKQQPKGPRMTLGLPTRLFPTEFLTEAEQLEYVTDFNTKEDRDRGVVIQNDKGCGLLAYKSSVWIAAWFFNKDHGKNYLYGVTYAYKATPATIARVEGNSSTNASMGWTDPTDTQPAKTHKLFEYAEAIQVKYGKTSMIERTMYVTERMVKGDIDRFPMEATLGGYGRRDSHRRQCCSNWIKFLRDNLNSWKDEGNAFARLKENNDVRRCLFPSRKGSQDSLLDMMTESALDYTYSAKPRMTELLQTPFFKRELNEVVVNVSSLFADPATRNRRDVLKPWTIFSTDIRRLAHFLAVYPDASLDYCQQAYRLAHHVNRMPVSTIDGVNNWLRQNMPITSYLGIIQKRLDDATEQWANNPAQKERAIDYSTGVPTVFLQEFNDTIGMLGQLYNAQNADNDIKQPLKLEKPNRWRLTEFHDYLVAECFKLSTPNEKLNQDLFKQPVKLEHDNQKWTFFQPQDIHQLASWGRAVRNCVGSADSYRNGIKKKTHFIVLAMIDNQPRFTIQLTVSNGVLNVDQISDICNKRLDDQQRNSYQTAFGQAIKILEQQLVEAA